MDAVAYVNLPNAVWIAPEKISGGNVGFGIIVPVRFKEVDVDIDAFAQAKLPDGAVVAANRRFEFEDSSTRFGDPLLKALIGWKEGKWNWNVGALLNIPSALGIPIASPNIGFNRWALDTTAAVTWLDAERGHEVSVAAGFTFNGENPDTDYDTGTEFHVEWALIQHFSKTFTLGLAGYHYQQVTGDSGTGARLGDFKGRVSAIGPVMTYTFMHGKTPISTQLEWMREFGAQNRTEGDEGCST